MPFGFWVLGDSLKNGWRRSGRPQGLKCLSAFGFWGTVATRNVRALARHRSQMPFGFWVLGDFPCLINP